MRGWYVIVLILGIVLAGAAGTAVYMSLSAARQAAPPPVEVQRVVVARDAIAAGTTITTANVGSLFDTTLVPANQVPQDAVTSTSGLEGRTVTAAVNKGDTIRAGALSQASTLSLGSVAMPAGAVPITMPVAENTALGIPIRPSDRVDLIVTLPVRQTDGSQRTVTQVLFRDVPVVAVNGDTTVAAPSPSNPVSAAIASNTRVSSITAAVSPQEALEIRHLLNNNIRVDVLPRRKEDPTAASTAPVTTDAIIRRLGLSQTP